MLATLISLKDKVLTHLPSVQDDDTLVAYKNSILGKNGELTEVLKGIKDLSLEEKQTI